ncbi:MAG: hypothetical protein LBI72_03590 [Flavobacteriaceae bacterium]|jgi:hypothetical protein|nr:hypothetical protein [Flavobacteriaceae bacterium]
MEEVVRFLEAKLSNQELMQQMVNQLNKDFQLAVDTSIEFKSNVPDTLANEVLMCLEKIATTSVAKFSSLLYRIDVSETEVDAIKGVSFEEYLQQITFLILKREFQKVYIRSAL